MVPVALQPSSFLFFLSLSASPIPRRGARVSKTFIVAWASARVLATPCLPPHLANYLPLCLSAPSLLSQYAFGRQGRHGYELWTGLGPRSCLPRSM